MHSAGERALGLPSVLHVPAAEHQQQQYGKIYDIYFPPPYLRLFDVPAVNIVDMWRILGRAMVNGGLVVGTIIKPKLGLRPKPFGEACYAFWQGGEFIKNDEPQAVPRPRRSLRN